ncbi:MAG: carbohydrate ABC transporter permease [bacterium]
MRRRRARIGWRTIAIHAIAWTVAIVWTIPFIGVFMTAIRPVGEIFRGWWNFAEFSPSFGNFVDVLLHPTFPVARGYLNSLLVAVPATLIPMFVATLGGYAFARFRFPTRDYLFLTIVLLMAFPQQMVAIPLFQLMVNVDLVDTHLGLILLHSAWGLPWIILFMRNFLGALPVEVEEAAKVDGASDFQVFFRIVLPMALPALASVAVLQFMWVWNDFFFALILMFTPEQLLATQLIPKIGAGQFIVDQGLLSAGSILVLLVPLLLYVLLQKYYIRGMIGWTVKG